MAEEPSTLQSEDDQAQGVVARSREGRSQQPLERWQERLLPFMLAMIFLLAIFFFIASLFQLYALQRSILATPQLSAADLPDFSAQLAEGTEFGPTQALAAERFQVLAALDLYSLQRRHHQANVLLMAREWVRYLGFVTGMVLAFLGAIFILGKLREKPTKASAKGLGSKLGLETTSPGIFLVAAGVLLMVVTIVTHHDIYVQDSPVYTQVDALLRSSTSSVTDRPQAESTPTPPPLRGLGE